MIKGIKYDNDTGAIVMGITASDKAGVLLQEEEGYSVAFIAELPDPTTSFFTGGEITPRPEMQLTIPDSGTVSQPYRVEGIPEGTTLYYPGGEVVVNDGYFEWSTVESGTYKFRLENFPYQEVKIDADFSTA